ncbi:DUF2381 family protein [Archangium violaceum]|uniref:DUF2381 family protein n=1 Tax=Archangium violaceum TaxID=83451 RepID=UPI001952684B|nr:DUF2381 family protein [Archangium violaceum]QRN94342.1 DUF2381 family protein [Archangium violaceum]
MAGIRTQTEQKSPGSIIGLINSGLVVGKKGIAAQDISNTTRQSLGEALERNKAYSYRAEGRVAVALEVDNTSAQPWTVDEEGAALVSRGGARLRVLRVWQPEPLPPGGTDRVVVEVEATEEQARGTYVLRLGEASGPRTITLRGVTFP